ncbi:RNA-directed DNA polymerase, eukaryota, reverse transcriptase zinc-binding domain protein, partial [Tanacetum coccineum]
AADLLQKERVNWCTDGDENSKFFHRLINQKRRQVAIRGEQRVGLELSFTEQEIKDAVWGCGSDKAPGPDGFTFDFYKKFWSIIKFDVTKAVNQFHSCGKFPKGCNSSFITLIPKVIDPVFLKDYRPISLIGSFYKIIGKLLANRIAMVAGDLISEEQSGFVRGRQIMDGPLILNEIINWRKNKKEKTLVFKVDFEKAYDSLCWDFLQEVMHKMGFGSKWCKWIRGCLQSSMASVLVNGSPTNEFKIKRGLRQGDPLSPFLFIIAMEGLHMLIENAMNVSRIKGIEIDGSGIVLSHLFYADDINLSKCSLLGNGVQEAEVKRVVDGVGCLLIKTLSVGGRVTLLKSVLGSIAIYLMSIFKTPITVLNNIESIRNKFFLGAEMDERKLTWIQWRKTMASKKHGGLGIGSLYGFNRALLFKWKWHFLNSPLALWVRIIKSLFGNDGGFAGISSSRRGGSVGDGRATCFWEDLWIGTRPLKDLFPRVWALDQEFEPMVCDRIHLMRDGSWLRHCPRGGVEREQWDALISLVQTHIVSDQMDRWLWSADGSGVFSVSMARVLIDKGTLVIGEEETRWSKLVPIKINVFMWRMILDKLPTRLNLMLRGLDVQSNLCGICGTHIESIDHVMLHCQVASDLWRLIGRWWNLVIPVFISFKEFLSWLNNLNISSVSKKVFNVVVITVAWSI